MEACTFIKNNMPCWNVLVGTLPTEHDPILFIRTIIKQSLKFQDAHHRLQTQLFNSTIVVTMDDLLRLRQELELCGKRLSFLYDQCSDIVIDRLYTKLLDRIIAQLVKTNEVWCAILCAIADSEKFLKTPWVYDHRVHSFNSFSLRNDTASISEKFILQKTAFQN